MRKLVGLVALVVEIAACTQVAGLDAEYTSSQGDAGGNVSSSSSGAVADASASSSSGAASSSGDSGAVTSSSSSGSSSGAPDPTTTCGVALAGTPTECARCVLLEEGCSEVCVDIAAREYVVCLRKAADKGEAEDCVQEHIPQNGARRSRQIACIDRCAADDRPCQ